MPEEGSEKKFRSVGLERHDDAIIILPEGMELKTGARWLRRMHDEQQEFYAVYVRTDMHPLDGAYALARAIARIYGHALTVPTPSFFGSQPPSFIDVPVDAHGTSVKVPWGRFKLPGMDGDSDNYLQTTLEYEGGRPVFVLMGNIQKMFEKEITRLEHVMKEILLTESIYRGSAIRVSGFAVDADEQDGNPTRGAPKFIDVEGHSMDTVVLNERVANQVETFVLTPIRMAEQVANLGINKKRGVLLHGTYGTGKTLISRVIAAEATKVGMTFIYLSNAAELVNTYRFAMQYAPSVLFVEDIDKEIGGDRRTAQMNEVLNILDGIDSKDAEVITIFTTNEVGSIHQAFNRPGRIDVIIEIEKPDAESAIRLVELYAGPALSNEIDRERIGEALAGNIPALVAEVVNRSMLSALRRGGQASEVSITTDDILMASGTLDTARNLLEENRSVETPVLAQAGKAALHAISQGVARENGAAEKQG